jgi:hypothetical protein
VRSTGLYLIFYETMEVWRFVGLERDSIWAKLGARALSLSIRIPRACFLRDADTYAIDSQQRLLKSVPERLG